MNDFIVKNGVVSNGSIKGNTGTVTGNATLDLSTGDAFEVTPTADVTFAFSNPPAAGNAQAFSVALNGVEVGTPYDLANASYESVNFSVAGQDTTPEGVFLKPDGTKMYVVGNAGNDINEYSLSTAWDISTASYAQNFSVSSQDTDPREVTFKPDGTKMYIVGASSDSIHEYNLSTAWDISTTSFLQSFSLAVEETAPTGVFFKPDGTIFYIVGGRGSDGSEFEVNQYELTTAWDISTASHSKFFTTNKVGAGNIFFEPSGLRFFLLDRTGDDVNEYILSTAWDVSTSTYVRDFSVAGQDSQATGLFFKSDGTKMYVVGYTTDTVYQYSTGTAPAPATITYPASVQWSGGTAPDAPDTGETDLLTFYTEDGGTTYYGFKVGDALA